MKSLVFRITEYCNLRCEYCYAERAEKGVMTFTLAKALAERFLGDTCSVQFTGGEPLLEIDLMESVIQYIRSLGKRVRFSVQTNATLIDAKMASCLKRLKVGVGVSLDGVLEANGLRVFPGGEPSFHRTAEGIMALREAGVDCNVNLVLTRVNQSRLNELADLCAYLGNVRGIGFDVLRPIGRACGKDLSADRRTLRQDLDSFMDEIRKLESLGVSVKVRELEKIRKKIRSRVFPLHYCHAASGCSLTMDYKGNLYPCSSLLEDSHFLGHVSSAAVENRVFSPDDTCRACGYFTLCRGGCRASREDSDCWLHRYWIERVKDENSLFG